MTVVATNKVDEKRKNELEENNVKLLDDFNRSNVLRYFQRLLMLIKHEKIEAKSSGLPCLLSDKISREADLASGISFLSIENPMIWKEKVIEVADIKVDRISATQLAKKELSANGYNSYRNISDMDAMYNKLLMNKGKVFEYK
ncbi:putative glycosyltransferase EpsF [Streptococcus infantarius subsp. infantarius]|nr:putative glycosyltransferase EpsF [Streptococcus infantarius subsp. infantarius]